MTTKVSAERLDELIAHYRIYNDVPVALRELRALRERHGEAERLVRELFEDGANPLDYFDSSDEYDALVFDSETTGLSPAQGGTASSVLAQEPPPPRDKP